MQRPTWGLGMVLALSLLAQGLHADTAAAAAAYKRAQQFQTAKQWGGAVKEYKAALAADPNYIWAYKGLGTTYYMAGDKKGALGYYDRYLQSNPKDTQVKAFADRLRGEVGGPAAGGPMGGAAQASSGSQSRSQTEAQAQAEGSGKPFKSGLSLGLGAGILFAGADDLNKPSAGCSTCKAFGSGIAFGGDLGLDYGLEGGFVIGARFGYGPNRSHVVDYSGSGYTSKTTADISNMLIGVTPGYRFATGSSGWVEARVGVAMMMTTLTYTYTSSFGSSPATKYTGSGFAVWPELSYVAKFSESMGASFGAGYMISSVSPLLDDKGKNAVYYTTGSSSPTNFGLSTGGLSLRVGINLFL